MKVEGASQQNIAYSQQNPVPIKSVKEIAQQVEPVAEIRTSGVEIQSHRKQVLGYQPTIQEKLIIESIEVANKKILGPEREFEFAIHQKTKQIMVKVLNKETQEVIREIPAEKVLDAVAHMCEIAGIFMDEKR